MSTQPSRIDVVTVFLEHEGKILILKRSKSVKTMKGKWAGISGYIENREKPLSRALKEIEEETGLSGEDVQLVNIGKQLEAVEKARPETVWVVHPFLFSSNSNMIKLDRENENYHWIDPEKIENYDTVPKLKEALVSAMQGVS